MKTVQLLFVCGLMLIALQAQAQYGQNHNLEVPQATGTMVMDGLDNEAAWANAPTVDLTANWDGAWSGHPSPDVTATAKLLWTTDTLYLFVKIEDFEPFYWGPPGSPYKGEQILIGVDGTHTDDTATNSDWGGWPSNAPDKGATTYKISQDLISLNWGFDGIMPIDSGWTHGTVFVDTVNYVWGVEMAIYVPQIAANGKIGFNIGGANANQTWFAEWDSTDHAYAYYSWLSAGSPGGDVMHVAKSFGTLDFITGNIYGQGVGLDVPFVGAGTLTMDGLDNEAAWANAPTVDLTTNWDGAWSGHPSPDVTSTAKLLWTNDTLYAFVKIEDFEPFYWGPPGSPYKGEQILIGVDGTHTDDTATNSDWGGWPSNAPDKGATTYKISQDLISLNWGFDGIMPIDSGWTHGTVFVDTVNYIWGVEMAMYMPQVQANGKIGFNIGGANANQTWFAEWDSTDHAYAYYSWLSAGSPGGDVMHVAKSFGTISLTMPTGIGKEQEKLPVTYTMSQNYPNPFNPSTTIQYALPRSGNVRLVVYNLLGQEVAKLVDGQQSAGEHAISWNAKNVSSGMYFYRLTVDEKPIAVRKMMLLK